MFTITIQSIQAVGFFHGATFVNQIIQVRNASQGWLLSELNLGLSRQESRSSSGILEYL